MFSDVGISLDVFTTITEGSLTGQVSAQLNMGISNINSYCSAMLEYPNMLIVRIWYYPVTDNEVGPCWVNRGLTRVTGAPLTC